MSVEIASIKDEKLQQIATYVDTNSDKKLSSEEYSIFAQQAMKQGATYQQVSEALDMNAFQRWWFDVDKVSTDGKDDGKLSFGEQLESFGKGIANLIKAPIQHPIATAVTVGAAAALTFVTGGAALPLIVAAGAVFGAHQVGAGVYKAAVAETDADAKRAFESIGTGSATLALSATGVKSANAAGAKSGIKSLQGLDKASWTENATAMFKAVPEAFKQSGANIKGNFLTWMSALKGDKVIYANSNATRTGVQTGVQAGNKVQDAYKVDLNGTVEEVLAKNPGLKYDAAQGKYYVETSWGENMYIQNENYMYVKYGESVDPATGKVTIDQNVVDGTEFYDTYIDHAKFEATGARRYINPEDLNPGEHVETSKYALARYKVVPEGTKYMSAEGQGTVQPGSVLRIDGQGRPYQSTVDFMLRKVQLTDAQIAELAKVDPVSVELYTHPNGILSKVPPQYRAQAVPVILEEREAWAVIDKGPKIGPNETASLKFRIALQGGRETAVKNALLNRMGVKLVYGINDYNGPDPLLGFAYEGKMYPLNSGNGLTLSGAQRGIDGIFDMISSGNMPEPVTEFPVSITQNGHYLR